MQGRVNTAILRAAAVLSLGGAALLLPSVGASAQAPDPAPVEAPGPEAGAIDFLAKTYQLSTDDAAARLREQISFLDLGADATKRYGEDSFDSWIENTTKEQTLHVRTTSSAVVETFANGLPAGRVIVEDAKPILPDARAAIAQTKPNDKISSRYVDTATGQIVVEVVGESDDPSLTADLQARYQRGSVTVQQLNEPLADTATMHGGSAISGCTAAFTATQSPNIGFYTAAHCVTSGSTSYWNTVTASGSSIGTGARAGYVHGANADIAFVKMSSNSISNTFYREDGATRIARGARLDSVANGSILCTRGSTNGYRCGTTTSTAYQPTWANACNGATCNAVFIRVSVGTSGGDSGGPWFTGDRPIGVHKGGNGSESVFSMLFRGPAGVSLY